MKKLLFSLLFLPVLGYSQNYISISNYKKPITVIEIDTNGIITILDPLHIKEIKVGDKVYKFNIELKEEPKPVDEVHPYKFLFG